MDIGIDLKRAYEDGYVNAIDEFAERLLKIAPKNYAGALEMDGITCYLSACQVKEIAKQLKRGIT